MIAEGSTEIHHVVITRALGFADPINTAAAN